MLAAHLEALAGRRQDPRSIRPGDQQLGKSGGSAQHVLAIVEHEQEVLPGQRVDQRLGHRRLGLGVDTEGAGDGIGHRRRVTDRREVHHPRAVAKTWPDRRRDLDGESGLSHPADTRERDKAVRADVLDDRREQLLSTDEGSKGHPHSHRCRRVHLQSVAQRNGEVSRCAPPTIPG